MISVQFTYDEAQALVDFIWGEESDQEALRTANISSQPSWTLCVPRISSIALTSRVAIPAVCRDDHPSCACGSSSS